MKWMWEAAEGVLTDHEYRHSDYGGMERHNFRDRAKEFVAEFNKKC